MNRELSDFKNFRHTYRTVVDEAGDQPAILLTMGHADSGISDYYRHGISDERLNKVSQVFQQMPTELFGFLGNAFGHDRLTNGFEEQRSSLQHTTLIAESPLRRSVRNKKQPAESQKICRLLAFDSTGND